MAGYLHSLGRSSPHFAHLNMKSFIVLALCVAAALAAPPYNSDVDKQAVVVNQRLENIGDGQYDASYQTSNGIAAEEQGQLKNVGSENEALEVRGRFSYTGTDGVTYSVEYVANEDGFQPVGVHIPQA